MVYFFSRPDALHSPFPFRISRRFCFCVYLFTVDVGVFFAVLSVVTWMAATCAGAWTIHSTPALTIPGSSLATTFTFSPHVGRRTYVTAFICSPLGSASLLGLGYLMSIIIVTTVGCS